MSVLLKCFGWIRQRITKPNGQLVILIRHLDTIINGAGINMSLLLCFAVKEEAAVFRQTPARHSALAVRPPSP
jgi:hypothetical protein